MNIQIKVGVIIKNDDKILLIKEIDEKTSLPKWNVIKGSNEINESVFETAIRECEEEANANAELLNSLGVYISKENEKARIQFNFLVETKNENLSLAKEEEQKSRNEHIIELKWFSRDELLKLSENDFISFRQYQLVRDFLDDKIYPLDVCKSVKM